MCCGCERSGGLNSVDLVDDCGNLNPQSIVRDDKVVKHDKRDREVIQRYKLLASREQHAASRVVVQYIRHRSIPLV